MKTKIVGKLAKHTGDASLQCYIRNKQKLPIELTNFCEPIIHRLLGHLRCILVADPEDAVSLCLSDGGMSAESTTLYQNKQKRREHLSKHLQFYFHMKTLTQLVSVTSSVGVILQK